MSVPSEIASPPAGAPVERPRGQRALDRLAEKQYGFLQNEVRRQASFYRSVLRGMTFGLRPAKVPRPLFIRDDRLALALDWYMVGKDIRQAMSDFEKAQPAIREAVETLQRDGPTLHKLVEQAMRDIAARSSGGASP